MHRLYWTGVERSAAMAWANRRFRVQPIVWVLLCGMIHSFWTYPTAQLVVTNPSSWQCIPFAVSMPLNVSKPIPNLPPHFQKVSSRTCCSPAAAVVLQWASSAAASQPCRSFFRASSRSCLHAFAKSSCGGFRRRTFCEAPATDPLAFLGVRLQRVVSIFNVETWIWWSLVCISDRHMGT